MQELLINVESKEIRCAFLKNGLLNDLIIERSSDRQITGNIYKGTVKNILQNIQSAFIDIAENENGFIHISDILENTKKFKELFDLDFEFESKKKPDSIDQLLKPDQPVLVQVVKEPIGNKGARLTSNISLAGRYLVLLPNSPHRGVSRKIENRQVRDKLKKFIRSFEMPKEMGLICRTNSVIATPEALIDETRELIQLWQQIVEKFQKTKGTGLLYQESDLIKRALTRAVDKRFERVLVDDHATYKQCKRYYEKYTGEHPLKIELYRDKTSIFERFNVEKEIEKALRRKIWLPSGGYLYFDETEAMHTIDVNSGRSQKAEKNVEESLVQINLQAAEEIARQLRLRNLGGLIICDFIDMRFRKSQRRVLERLKECVKEDKAKCTILGVSEFGLIEMARQRSRGSLFHMMFTSCPYCIGKGLIKSHESVAVEIERALKKIIHCEQKYALKLVVHPNLFDYLKIDDSTFYENYAQKENARLEFATDDTLHLNDFQFVSTTNDQIIEV